MYRSIHDHESTSSPPDIDSSDSEEVASGVGQLSLNEHEQFRYHGKVSGLHLLGRYDRLDKRNEGGIWRFPQAKVWPQSSSFGLSRTTSTETTIPNGQNILIDIENEIRKRLPNKETQAHLLDLFWTYVHPVIPVLDREGVMDAWKDEVNDANNETTSARSTTTVPINQPPQEQVPETNPVLCHLPETS